MPVNPIQAGMYDSEIAQETFNALLTRLGGDVETAHRIVVEMGNLHLSKMETPVPIQKIGTNLSALRQVVDGI
jgi:hypothetical protein